MQEDITLTDNLCIDSQIRKNGFKKPEKRAKSYTKYFGMGGKYPGDKVQANIKYLPKEFIKFPTCCNRYYQITAIDEYSRKRILKIVKEKSSYETGKFLETPETEMGFKIKTIQVDKWIWICK